jgi:hypothetical protein
MPINNPKIIVIHNSAVSYKDSYDQLKAINDYHKKGHPQAPFPISSLGYYVGYHHLITGGKNYKCRLDSDEGAHCNSQYKGMSVNFQSLGICVGFNGDIEMPPDWAYKLLQEQIWDWQDTYNISNDKVFFHRDFTDQKTCPGNLLSKMWLEQMLKRPDPIPKATDQIPRIENEIYTIPIKPWYKDIIDRFINWFINYK